MSMMRYTYDYNGMRYTIDAPAGATAEDLQALIGGGPQQAAQPPAQPTPPEEEESYLSTLGRAARRGISSFESGLAEIAETAPEIIGTLAGNLIPGAPVASKLLGGIGQQISKTEPYRELTHPTAQGLRQSAQERLAEIGPRQYRGVFEEEGLGRKLASLGETVAESAIPVGAGVATGLVTRSPVAAGIVMGAGNVPMTYGGIRERQKAEGIDDVQRAVVGTIASSALDIMAGVGGKVLSGTAAVAAREILESGLKQAAVRIAKSGGEEAVTESLQNIVEQVAGGTDPTTKQAMLETLESGLAGALGGTVFTGGSELVTAPFRPKGGAATETNTDIAESPEVQQEYLRLVSEQTAARMQAEPGLTQRQAFDRVLKDSASLYDTAVTNVLGGTIPSGKADVDTGLDVSGGAEPSISPAGAAVPTGAVPGEREPSTAGGVGEPTTSVSAVAPSTAAGEPALDLGEFAPTVATLQEAPSNKARKPIAMQLVSDVVQANPDLQGLSKNKYSQAANQMVLAAARGEQFDPVAIVQGVAPKPKAAPEVETASEQVFEDIGEEPGGNVTSLGERRAAKVMPKVKALLAGEISMHPDDIGDLADDLDDLRKAGGIDEATFDNLEDQLFMLERRTRAAMRPQNDNVPETPIQKAERELSAAGDAFNSFFYNPDDERMYARKNSNAFKEWLREYEALNSTVEEKHAVWNAAWQDEHGSTLEDIGGTPAPTDLTDQPSSNTIYALAQELPTTARVSVRARLDRVLARHAKDGDIERLVGSLEALRQDVDRRIDRERTKRGRERVRGFERAMEVIYRAERTGQLSPEGAGLIRWLLEQNPAIADELAISIREGAGQKAAGQYNPAARVATIFASRANDGTAAHEVLHHAERLMPENVRVGIRAAWMKRIQDLIALADKTNNTNMREVLGTIVRAYYGDTEAQKILKESFEAGTIPYSAYHLSNPSEFWAVNATDLVGKRAKQTGWLGAARAWLRGLIEKAKDLFGLTNDSAVITGLKAVLAVESGTVSGSMLASGTATFADTGAQPKVVSNGKEVKLTEAQTRAALEKVEATRRKLNRIQKRIANTNRTADVLSGQIELGKLARGDKENLALLRGAVDTLDVGKWKLILPTLSTEDIFRILKGRIEGLTEADRLIRQDVTRFETKEYLALADELEQIADFLKKHPKAAQALSDLQFASVAYQVDPSKAANAEEYADKFDKKTRELQAELNNTAVTDAKKQRSLKTKIDNRLREIRSVYEGALLDDGRVFGWRDLARPELGANKGKEIFKLIRDAHRRDLEASYNTIKSRLEETKEGEKLDEALEKLEEQFKPAREQTIYFPAMRFGQFYARVGTGANSIFKMFETETKRNQFMRLMKARGEEITQFGNVDDLRNQFESVTGSPLKDVLDLFEDNPRDIAALRSQVFDLWLQTMSAGDMRKHMAPRMMRAGYSTDILKNFANFRRSSINSAKRAQFGYKLRNEISRAKDSIEGQPDRAKMQEFVKEVELRVMSDLTPPERGNTMWQQALRFGNKVAFYQYLANPKTAIIQLTQMHIVALPMLAQKYGTAKATAALGKYGFSSLGGFTVGTVKAIPRPGNGWTVNWEQPNLLDNPISSLKKESDPELYEVLSEGWQEDRDINPYMDTFANDIGGYGMADPKQRNALQELAAGRVLPATLRGATFVFESMGTLMHQMERVNREATYMAALELGYRENRKKGQTHEVAKKAAIEEATATTLAATFDFSAYNKPRVLTTPVGRVAGQFFTYPYMMTSLLMRNMYTAIKVSGLEPGERSAAIKVATGTFANIVLYSGLTGLPLYGVFKIMGYLLSSLFGEDDDTDWDWWFRNEWIPQFFGPDGTVANLLGLDDAQAELLARSVEKGPISALTDVDLSNSVALDFMFFLPEAPRAETPEGQVMETVFNMVTGAAGGALMDYVKAGRDVATGYSERALEKMPKVISNVAKANRFGTEGQLNYAGELAGMDKEFWTSDKQILLALGFNSTEAAQRQQQNYEGRAITDKVEKARETALSLYRKVAIDVEKAGGMTDELRPDYDAAIEAVNKFNAAHPEQLISPNTLFETQVNAVLKMRESQFYEGVPVEKRGKTPHLEDILRRRVNQAEE